MHKINHGLTSLLFSMLSLWSIFFAFIACAHAVVEGQDDFITAIDPALGISVQLGRWNGAINLVYDPDGAPDLFSEADEVLNLLGQATAEWELVSGIQFNIVGSDPDVPDDDGFGPNNLDGLVRVFWGSAGGAAGRAARVSYVACASRTSSLPPAAATPCLSYLDIASSEEVRHL